MLKLDPSGVECPQPWNSEATAVSVVGGNAPLRGRSDQDNSGLQAHLHYSDNKNNLVLETVLYFKSIPNSSSW